jgi:hypothetical protein
VQHTIAMFNMYVGLPHNFKGTHMSRFVEILNSHEREISVENFPTMLRDMVVKLEAETGHIEMNFPYFINKTAPISGVQSLMDYDVTFIGDICHGEIAMSVKVVVPVTSLCPCSKKISEYGAHNQRSHVTVTARTNEFVDRGNCPAGRTGSLLRTLRPPQASRMRNTSPNAPTTTPSSLRTWFATLPPAWMPKFESTHMSSNPRISSPSTITLPTRWSKRTKIRVDYDCCGQRPYSGKNHPWKKGAEAPFLLSEAIAYAATTTLRVSFSLIRADLPERSRR